MWCFCQNNRQPSRAHCRRKPCPMMHVLARSLAICLPFLPCEVRNPFPQANTLVITLIIIISLHVRIVAYCVRGVSCNIFLGTVLPEKMAGFRARTRHLLDAMQYSLLTESAGERPIRGQLMWPQFECTVESTMRDFSSR